MPRSITNQGFNDNNETATKTTSSASSLVLNKQGS